MMQAGRVDGDVVWQALGDAAHLCEAVGDAGDQPPALRLRAGQPLLPRLLKACLQPLCEPRLVGMHHLSIT